MTHGGRSMAEAPGMITLEASVPVTETPTWAVLQRSLFALLHAAADVYLDRYTRPDGSLKWTLPIPSRDGADDFYESFYHLPLLYLLGGRDDLLERAHHHWEGVTRQLDALGLVHQEYERGYDQFHQSEANLYFTYLCMADPDNVRLNERARRFAGFFIGDDTNAPNYDPEHNILRAPHNGSQGPRWGVVEGDPYGAVAYWSPEMAVYGLPFYDVPGITRFDDIFDPALGRQMGEVMNARLGRGDAAVNLLATTLVTNAYLLTGDARYAEWVVRYVNGWIERTRANGGIMPDNVGLSGVVGEYMNGQWYGGNYGWMWPHGVYTMAQAALVGAGNAFLLSREPGCFELPRGVLDLVIDKGVHIDPTDVPMSLRGHVLPQLPEVDGAMFLVPYRFNGREWFDYQPLLATYPAVLWNLTHADADWARIERLRAEDRYDWRAVVTFRAKEDAGHEAPWLRYLAGDNPTYPETVLRAAHAVVYQRLAQIRQDKADLDTTTERDIATAVHHWQELNPLTTEALVQLTLGAPSPLYNGGLLFCQVRYFDALRRRPGLPPGVAALVDRVDAEGVRVWLVNLDAAETPTVIVQAGAFAEHRITRATYTRMTDGAYPGVRGIVRIPSPAEDMVSIAVDAGQIAVRLPPGCQMTLRLELTRFAAEPTYALPWSEHG